MDHNYAQKPDTEQPQYNWNQAQQTQKPFTSPKTNTATQIKEKRKKKI